MCKISRRSSTHVWSKKFINCTKLRMFPNIEIARPIWNRNLITFYRLTVPLDAALTNQIQTAKYKYLQHQNSDHKNLHNFLRRSLCFHHQKKQYWKMKEKPTKHCELKIPILYEFFLSIKTPCLKFKIASFKKLNIIFSFTKILMIFT